MFVDWFEDEDEDDESSWGGGGGSELVWWVSLRIRKISVTLSYLSAVPGNYL